MNVLASHENPLMDAGLRTYIMKNPLRQSDLKKKSVG